MLRSRFVLATALLLVAAAQAHQFSVGKLVIDHPWARPTTAGMPVGVAYLSITNHGSREDTLIGAQTRPAGPLAIRPGETLTAAPGGLHLMLVDLKTPLVDGETIPLVLSFKDAGEITVQLKIESH